jgi:streptomycin 6-kinase
MALHRVPALDEELRRRLGRRFGSAIEPWLDELPPVLSELAERWQISLESLIQGGTISVVIMCRTATGRPAVLKISPEPSRVLDEAAVLARWTTTHVPAVLAVDESVGALLIEAIEPSTPLADSMTYPHMESLAALITALHAYGAPDPSYRPVAERVAYFYEAGEKNYQRRPDLAGLIPRELYERGRQRAMRLASDAPRAVLLHGDLTPVNVLDGGTTRGLVAIDPAPCLGDPAFDAVDLVLWQAEDVDTITARAEQLAPEIGAEPERLFRWCAAFAAMLALELAEAEASDDTHKRVDALVALARAKT